VSAAETERLRRWRLVLGGGAADGIGCGVTGDDARMDGALAALYGGERGAGLDGSSPNVARWLGDIRSYFPSTVVELMQKDAMERLNLHQLLLEPEVLATVQPDVHLVSTLISLNRVIPEHTKETARLVVRQVVDEVERRLEQKTRQAITGALDRSARTSRPRRLADVNWNATIRANLQHYRPELGTIVPERLIGHARRQQEIKRDILLCVDQSGSMASSVVYSSIFAAVLASIRALRTSLVLFDTSVVDMTEQLSDPVEVLFGAQLGGGTDIAQALRYTESLITDPAQTVVVLISDLLEGGNEEELRRRARALVASGAQVVVLLALSDDGSPAFDHDNAAYFASLGSPAFACTPDQFPDLIAAAIERRDIPTWAAKAGITTTRAV
jgi:Mg-chelatase subunit ChlD